MESELSRVNAEIRQVEMELVELEKTRGLVAEADYAKDRERFRSTLSRLVERREKLQASSG